MSDDDSRDRSDRIGSLLSLVPASLDETGADARRPVDGGDLSAAERHRLARSRREAAASPLGAALAQARRSAGMAEPVASEPASVAEQEQERELKALFASRGTSRATAGDAAPRPAAVFRDPEEHDRTPKRDAEAAARRRGMPAKPVERRPDAHAEPEPVPADVDPYWRPLVDPVRLVRGVLRSGWIIAAATVCGAAIAAAIALATPKQYIALTELIIDPRQLRIVQNELTDGGLTNEAMLAVVENQVRVLRSGVVLGKVVDTLGLDRDAEFNGTRDGGPFSILADFRSLLSPSGARGDPAVRRRALAIEHLGEATDVVRGGKTFVVAVTGRSESPEKSALIVNTLTEVFLETYGSIQAGAAGRASDEIAARLSELRDAVEDAERRVEAFKSENDIVDAQGRLITDDEIVKLNDQLSTARARTLELQARADSARTITVDAALAGNLPEQMNSPVLTEMRTQYSLLRQEADRIGTRLGPRHPERLAIDAQVDAARGRVEQELRLVASSIQVELRRAVQLEQELAARLAQLKARQAGLSGELVTLREFEREAAAKRAVYEAFLLRAGETGQQRDLNTANVSVISKATPPLEPSGPSRSLMTLLGAVLGFGAGVGIGAARGVVDSLRADGALGRTGQAPRRAPIPQGPRPSRRGEGEPGPAVPAREAAEHADETAAGASRLALDTNRTGETAATAEETDMHYARAPMGWTAHDDTAPAEPYPHPRNAHPYQEAMQHAQEARRQGMYPGDGSAGYAAYPTAPAYPQLQPQFDPRLTAYPPIPQAHAHHHQPMPSPAYGGPAAPPMPPQGQAYGQYPAQPQGWNGHPSAQPPVPRPMDPRGAPQHPHAGQPDWAPSPYPAMQEPGYPYGYPDRQAMAPGWPQPGWPQPGWQPSAPARPQHRPDPQPPVQAASSGEGDRSAMEEIRDSLREFREALRVLSETRNRRRFL